MPLADDAVVLGVVVLPRILELLDVIALRLAGAERLRDGQHTCALLLEKWCWWLRPRRPRRLGSLGWSGSGRRYRRDRDRRRRLLSGIRRWSRRRFRQSIRH